MPKAIIFDFDGVIVDSEPLHYQAFVMVGRSFGYSFTYEQYMAQYIGFDDRDAFRYMLGQAIEAGHAPEIGDQEAYLLELIEKKRVAFEAIAAMGTAAIPGAVELIDQASAVNLPIAIASGATQADIDQMLRLLKRRDRFEIIVAADDVAASKPDPTTYALAAARISTRYPGLGLAPADMLAIEDTSAGLASAQGAGLRTLGLTTTGPKELVLSAERVIEDLDGVTLEDLNQWYG
ncbi:MAG: HAD family phosphatase [Planctomycetota bacterium]